jgi:hypothetical protein
MANIVELDKSKISTALANVLGGADANDDLSAGVSGGFSVISFRGSKWRVKHGGEETLLTDSEGEALPSLRVVMLKANKDVSKNYYENGFVEGSTDAPTCWSLDGKRPDSAVERPVSPACANCPKNAFGSRVSDNGSKGKACSDVRRVAVVPEGDYQNDIFGGPMLLRVPAASLGELASFGKAMKAKGFPYNTIVTRISFDPDTAYPKLKFNAVRPLRDEEANELVSLLRDDDYRQKIDYILASATETTAAPPVAAAPAAPKEADPTEFEEEVATVVKATATKAPKQPKPAPVVVEEEEAPAADPTVTDSELDDILAKLDSLE